MMANANPTGAPVRTDHRLGMVTMPESAARPQLGTAGTTVQVRVLTDNGTTARVVVESTGVLLRIGQTVTVPADQIGGRRPTAISGGSL